MSKTEKPGEVEFIKADALDPDNPRHVTISACVVMTFELLQAGHDPNDLVNGLLSALQHLTLRVGADPKRMAAILELEAQNVEANIAKLKAAGADPLRGTRGSA